MKEKRREWREEKLSGDNSRSLALKRKGGR